MRTKKKPCKKAVLGQGAVSKIWGKVLYSLDSNPRTVHVMALPGPIPGVRIKKQKTSFEILRAYSWLWLGSVTTEWSLGDDVSLV